MQIYLPIAEISVNVFLLLGMGCGVGFLCGIFGVGGGFLITPLLIFTGISPAVAVATSANQIVGASVSGALAHSRRGNVDYVMGGLLLAGGLVGSGLGVWLFGALRGEGHLDLVILLSYVIFLGVIGALMLIESLRAMGRYRRRGTPARGRGQGRRWRALLHGLPLKMRFRKSRLYISALLPIGIGFVVGVLAAIMGVGGGFIIVPAMIYLLGMPTSMVVGTSLFQIIFVTANVTILHAYNNHTVDAVLALLLLVGGVIGAQLGSRAGTRLRGDQLRVMLALLVLGVCAKIAFDLLATPGDVFSLAVRMGAGS